MADLPPSASPDAFASPFAQVPPAALMRILSQFERDQLANFVEVAIGLLDVAEPDPDLEDCGYDELSGDEQDAAWTEHHTRGRHKLLGGMREPFDKHEDAEDDDADEEHDGREVTGTEDDFMNHGHFTGPGCPISDPGGCDEGF